MPSEIRIERRHPEDIFTGHWHFYLVYRPEGSTYQDWRVMAAGPKSALDILTSKPMDIFEDALSLVGDKYNDPTDPEAAAGVKNRVVLPA